MFSPTRFFALPTSIDMMKIADRMIFFDMMLLICNRHAVLFELIYLKMTIFCDILQYLHYQNSGTHGRKFVHDNSHSQDVFD